MVTFFAIFFSLLFIIAGIAHFIRPRFFLALFPEFIPFQMALIYLSGLAEIGVGIGLLLPSARQLSLWVTFWLLVIYTPLHIRDLFIDQPAVGNKRNAIVRMVIQIVMMGLLLFLLLK